jgi:hypothetical protein
MSGFVPDPGFYGEHSWDDVRMRVVGHVAVIGRDLARAKAMRQDWAGCAAAYGASAARVERIATATSTGAPIKAALLAAAKRDASLCDALARKQPPPPTDGTVAPLRRALVAARLAGEPDPVTPPVPPDASLRREAWDDFDDRHALRVRLVQAYADAVDPFAPSDPWGPWTGDEVQRQAALLASLSAAYQPRLQAAPEGFSSEELGALPTGDTLVDTAGFAGPNAIGKLAVRGLDDRAHRGWLEDQAGRLNAAPAERVPELLGQLVATLDQSPHRSRYYNVKQARNAGVRVLARRGDYAGALAVLRTNWPLHHQDWACPDRAAILHAIEGRLLLLAGDEGAEAKLDEALADADAFLSDIARAGG